MKSAVISIFALSFWIFILSNLYQESSKKLLSLNDCYIVDSEKVKLISKEKTKFNFSKNKTISYYSPYWMYNDIKNINCSKNPRGLASYSNKKYHLSNNIYNYIIETIEIFKGK